MPREPKLENVQPPGPSDRLARSGTESGNEGPSAVDAEPQVLSEEINLSSSPVFYKKEESGQQKSSVTPDPEAPVEKKRETPRILQSSAIGTIAYHFYGANSFLGIDLIKESNPQLHPNWISFDAGLRLPPLTKKTLQRKQPDGSYRLILASFPSLTAGKRFAQAISLKGYEVVITRRELSENISLHRVEIAGLKTIEAADHAWDAALANHWISFADNSFEKDPNEQNSRRIEAP